MLMLDCIQKVAKIHQHFYESKTLQLNDMTLACLEVNDAYNYSNILFDGCGHIYPHDLNKLNLETATVRCFTQKGRYKDLTDEEIDFLYRETIK